VLTISLRHGRHEAACATGRARAVQHVRALPFPFNVVACSIRLAIVSWDVSSLRLCQSMLNWGIVGQKVKDGKPTSPEPAFNPARWELGATCRHRRGSVRCMIASHPLCLHSHSIHACRMTHMQLRCRNPSTTSRAASRATAACTAGDTRFELSCATTYTGVLGASCRHLASASYSPSIAQPVHLW
jgi:hypothetical protein